MEKDLQQLEKELLDVVFAQIDKFKTGTVLGGRDFQSVVSTIKELRKLTGEGLEDKWVNRLQELVQRSDSIEKLVLGEPADFERVFGGKVIFDKGKKKVCLSD